MVDANRQRTARPEIAGMRGFFVHDTDRSFGFIGLESLEQRSGFGTDANADGLDLGDKFKKSFCCFGFFRRLWRAYFTAFAAILRRDPGPARHRPGVRNTGRVVRITDAW